VGKNSIPFPAIIKSFARIVVIGNPLKVSPHGTKVEDTIILKRLKRENPRL
jgi:hypothetical protein